MSFLGEGFRFIHVFFGAVGLAAFWVPVFAKKGAVNHVRFGKLFVWSAYIVLAAAGISLVVRVSGLLENGVGLDDEPSLYGFIVFLGYLTFVTFVFVRQGMAVLQHKRDFAGLRTTLNKLLAYGTILASTGLILYALILAPPNKILLLALSPIGFTCGFGNLAYMRSDPVPKRAWMYEHLGAMLGSGIAFHTAFAVFGSTRLFDIGLTGWVAIIPWVAPTAIGIPAIFLWTRHYRLKYRDPA
jgi:hypothetical protein